MLDLLRNATDRATHVRKFLVAVAGAAVFFVGQHYGVDSAYYDATVAFLTVLGVYAVPNAE